MRNDNTSSNTSNRNDYRSNRNIGNNQICELLSNKRKVANMVESKKSRIKRLIAEAHVKFITGNPIGSPLFWDLALNGIDYRQLYREFSQLELSQIIDSYTGELK